MLARFVSSMHEVHWNALKGILCHVKGKKNFYPFYGMVCGKHEIHIFIAYSWGDEVLKRGSTSGKFPYIGNYLVDWSSKRHSIITHRTEEDEYVATGSATMLVIWFRILFEGLDENQNEQRLFMKETWLICNPSRVKESI